MIGFKQIEFFDHTGSVGDLNRRDKGPTSPLPRTKPGLRAGEPRPLRDGPFRLKTEDSHMRAELNLLTPEDVSAMTGLSLSTLATWRSRGIGPFYVKVGRTVYYREQDLLEWIEKQVRETGNEHRTKETESGSIGFGHSVESSQRTPAWPPPNAIGTAPY
jgi:predicted DNA-binding transcriptional regulator AlpA